MNAKRDELVGPNSSVYLMPSKQEGQLSDTRSSLLASLLPTARQRASKSLVPSCLLCLVLGIPGTLKLTTSHHPRSRNATFFKTFSPPVSLNFSDSVKDAVASALRQSFVRTFSARFVSCGHLRP